MPDSDFSVQIQAMLPDLYRTAGSLLGYAADAEDLVHDTCVAALLSQDKINFIDNDACRAWVRRILINKFRDRLRRERRSPLRCIADLANEGPEDIISQSRHAGPLPDECAETLEFQQAVIHAIAALPAETRVIVTLYIVSELSYREIADTAQCPIGTVMSRLSRGRRLLRNVLQEKRRSAAKATAGQHNAWLPAQPV